MNHVSMNDVIEFHETRRIKKRIILTEAMSSEILCYEPGQGTTEHHHVKEDEAFFVIEGRGTISVDDEAFDVKANSLVFAPCGSRHGIAADKGSRLVVIYFRSPGRDAARTGMVIDPRGTQTGNSAAPKRK
jgi:mannose-6-phosphate isomerase-like protein (cupin superfamily)